MTLVDEDVSAGDGMSVICNIYIVLFILIVSVTPICSKAINNRSWYSYRW